MRPGRRITSGIATSRRAPHAGLVGRAAAALRAVLAGLVVLLALAAPAVAQVADDGSPSYLIPLQAGEAHRTLVVGDSLAEGMHAALLDALAGDPRVEIDRKPRWMSGFSRAEHAEELKDLAQALQRNKQHLVVVLTGTQDRWSLRTPEGRRFVVGSREWRDGYSRLVDEAMRLLKADGRVVYWVGLPIMRREEVNAAAVAVNEILRERAYLNGVKFIDVFAGFADENGEYSAYGPDLAGKIRQLRDRDGITMTEAGYAKLAHFVETELKRDLAQAAADRALPLAGDETEQARIRPVAKPAARSAPIDVAAGETRAGAGGAAVNDAATLSDQKAETSRLSIKSPGRDGREETVTVEIVRPAIPAAVLALVTRRESPDKAAAMGDSVVDQIPGGLTVMSSITPAGDAASGSRQKLSPAQTPYFRVLVKGERLTPRPGRADDTSWPKPEPEPEPKRADAAAPAIEQTAPGASSAGAAAATGSLPAERPRRPEPR